MSFYNTFSYKTFMFRCVYTYIILVGKFIYAGETNIVSCSCVLCFPGLPNPAIIYIFCSFLWWGFIIILYCTDFGEVIQCIIEYIIGCIIRCAGKINCHQVSRLMAVISLRYFFVWVFYMTCDFAVIDFVYLI